MALKFARKPKTSIDPRRYPKGAARHFIAAGEYDAAIEVLTEITLDGLHPEVEEQLIDLRHEVFLAHGLPETAPLWPPTFDDIFVGVDTIPEVNVKDLSVNAMRAGVLGHGALIVRGLFDEQHVARLQLNITKAFDAFDAAASGTSLSEVTPSYRPFTPSDPEQFNDIERGFIREGAGVLMADSPRGFRDWTAAVKENGLFDKIAEYFGERPALSLSKTTLRDVPADTNYGWHQDGAFLGKDIRSLNVWLALSDCGIDAPALDLVARRMEEIVPTGVDGAIFNWSVSETTVERFRHGAPIVRPVFAPGDAILFDQMNLHSTGVSPGMTKNRLAIESWFFAPSTYPMKETPFYL